MNKLPNIRKLFVPDPGYLWFDLDLNRADLQVVVWEANDESLKKALAAGLDTHLHAARDIFGFNYTDDEITEGSPQHAELKDKYYAKRHACKEGVHATNYMASPRVVAVLLGSTVREAERFQKAWFGAHPGIAEWHKRVISQLARTHQVTNKFGYRRYFFDRIDSIVTDALGWIPQSTVANVIDSVWENIDRELPEVEVLMQVHDSLGGQIPLAAATRAIARMKELSLITVPYDPPLVIPTTITTSQISWGDCH